MGRQESPLESSLFPSWVELVLFAEAVEVAVVSVVVTAVVLMLLLPLVEETMFLWG